MPTSFPELVMHGVSAPSKGLLALLPALLLLAALASPASAQDRNILYPIAEIEARLLAPELVVLDQDYTRPLEGDRSRRVTLADPDGGEPWEVHWKPVGMGAEGFNNQPRYELAAYHFQKLFLDESDYVVPPTVLRAMAIEEYREIRRVEEPTIRGTRSILFLLSYWLQNIAVDTVDPFDQMSFDRLPSYAWHWGNLNVFTHLIDHKDANHGNVLVSLDGSNTRVFAVDNDVAFAGRTAEAGNRWSRLLVDRIPDTTVERLREITLQQLHEELGVVAEFQIVGGYLYPMAPEENLQPGRGLRVTEDRVQFGLTEGEIRNIYQRIERLLERVDRGQITTFSREG
ncbi:MAG: hypothetical protein EA351_07980 [Gemmatimonadales bacterium]|nr:MAG: hypothetical protein EA351_07980 [Gemmatimonadales bacterium]